MENRVSRVVCIAVAAVITLAFVASGCDLTGGGAGSVVLEYTKAFHAGTRKTSLECPGHPGKLHDSRYSESNIQVKNYTVKCDDENVSSAEKANAITGKAMCTVFYARKESDDTRWYDHTAWIEMRRIHGSWCVWSLYNLSSL